VEVSGQHDDLAAFAWERTRYPLNRRRDGHLGKEKKSFGVYLVEFFFVETYA
jgi:hypothetical protein